MRTRDKKVTIRMTEKEYQSYLERREKSKLSANSFGLHCLLDHKINVIEDLPELMRQLKAIGNNLNQLARAANSGQAILPPVVNELGKGVEELWRWLKQLKVGSH